MELPSSWTEVTVSEFLDLQSIEDCGSLFEQQLDKLAVFTDEDLEEEPPLVITGLIKQMAFLNTKPSEVFKKTLGDYVYKPLSEVTWGEFIDLEHFARDGVKSLTTMAAIFYRKQSKDNWGYTIFEPYNYDPRQRGEEFMHNPITDIWGVVTEWTKYRNNLINNAYSNLFDGGKIPDEEIQDLPPEEIAQIRKEEAQQEAFSKWSYASITLDLAQGDVTKVEDVLNLKLVFVLNMLSARVATQ